METSEIIKTTYFKKVLNLIKEVLPVIIYPNEPESLAVKICKLASLQIEKPEKSEPEKMIDGRLKHDPHNDIYGPGNDDYGRDKGLSPIPEQEMNQIITQAKKNLLSEPNRRNRIDLFTPAETAIYKAQEEVEKMPADERLTKAGSLLQDARGWVADFIEDVPIEEHYPRPVTEQIKSKEAEQPGENNELQKFMNDIHEWADKTFGAERTALAPLYHLKKEVDESIKAMKQGIRPNTLTELADCFILILNASSKYRVTFDELLNVAKDKMEINKSRKWGKPDENGVCEHIKDAFPMNNPYNPLF